MSGMSIVGTISDLNIPDGEDITHYIKSYSNLFKPRRKYKLEERQLSNREAACLGYGGFTRNPNGQLKTIIPNTYLKMTVYVECE